MRIFADVAHELLVLPTGALTVAAVANQWQALTGGPLSSGILGESGRWGDLFGTVKTRENTYSPAYVKIAGLIQTNTAQMIQALRDEQYYPAIMPPSSVTLTRLFDNRTLASQHQLLLEFDTIPPQDATAWVTFDGSDPCNFDSKPNSAAQAVSLSPTATEYRVPLSKFLVDSASAYAFRVRVRVLDASQQWSAQAAADFSSPTRAPLKISAAAHVREFIKVSCTWLPVLIWIGFAAWN
jgi:hypothetical protein